MRMVPTEIFRARALLSWKGAVDVEETDDAYVLRWSEKPVRQGRLHALGRQGDLRAAALHRPLVGQGLQGQAVRPDLHRGHPRVQGAPGHAREPSAARAQVALDRARALAALGDRGDDQRLAAAGVAGGEHAVGGARSRR